MSDEDEPSAQMAAAITQFQLHHPGNACVDCLTVVYQAGVLDAGEAFQSEFTAPDSALGRCQALLQCHRETGHAGGHEAREEQ